MIHCALVLCTALSRIGHSVPLKFNPADHYIRTLAITPQHEKSDRKRVFVSFYFWFFFVFISLSSRIRLNISLEVIWLKPKSFYAYSYMILKYTNSSTELQGYCDAFVRSAEGQTILSRARGEDSNNEEDLQIVLQKKRVMENRQTYAAG